MKPYITTGKCPLGLDRKMVFQINGKWYWHDLMVWRKMDTVPKIDMEYSRRWFGYTS